MADYRDEIYCDKLYWDMVDQFHDKPMIRALVEVIATQMQDLYTFLMQLKYERDVKTAIGTQLDGLGDIVKISRVDAARLSYCGEPIELLDDETYRQYIIYKILRNSSNCTYHEIIKLFGMFWDRPLYYSEDPNYPATMVFDTGEMQGLVETLPLFQTPVLKAAGVTLRLYARTSTELEIDVLQIVDWLVYDLTYNEMPNAYVRVDCDEDFEVCEYDMSYTETYLPQL